MSIRMKEWGMMRAPADAVHIPVQGLTGWDSVARGLGEGVSSVVMNTAELVQGQERVQQTGELARFSQRLHDIDDETRAELAERDVKDWDYAWRAAYEPRLKEALSELPPAARQAGAELAQDYFQRSSLKAYRDRKVESLKKARKDWQAQVDTAVENGDEEQARQWLARGKDIFIAPAAEEEVARRTGSMARLSLWKNELAQNPLKALEHHRNATEEELPVDEQERGALKALAARYTLDERRAMAERITARLQQREELAPGEWGQALRSGIISRAQFDSATAPRRAMGDVERCRWFRKVDEAEDDADSLCNLRLEIATAPLPAQDRLELLRRVDANTGALRTDRIAMSNSLWNLYNAGAFGCPGDKIASRRLASLQRSGAGLLLSQGPDAVAAWLKGYDRMSDCWISSDDAPTGSATPAATTSATPTRPSRHA